ncbi:Rv1535 domain-containing protein [Mycobacterium sp. NPDC048908]|uniref:Rv1535 domain-containing protein n=1 Tax=Mycobacterium sp. NPDC048908 TaxID=3364292 RepID=UPI00371B944F
MPGFLTVAGVAGLSVSIGPDPLTDVVAGVLAVPLRELYAVLWRAGLVDIDD